MACLGVVSLEGRSPSPSGQPRLNRIRELGRILLLLPRDTGTRYWEIDTLRGVALVMMVAYHLAYDLAVFGYYRPGVSTRPWQVFADATAGLFVALAGTSLVLSSFRGSGSHQYLRFAVRGLTLLGWGMVITLVTCLVMGPPVIFGVLHLIGVATILALPFLRFRWLNLVLGTGLIALGIYVNQLLVASSALLWLGLRPFWRGQMDYRPLLPWFGVVLLGVFLGHLLYPEGARRFSLPVVDRVPGVRGLVWLGRHSLLIYLVHQPILITGLALLGGGSVAW